MKNPWYITGICDGEGCFSISFNFRNRFKSGIEVRPSFSVSLNKRDLDTIKMLNDFFGIGGIRFSKNDQCYKFEVRSVKELYKFIIPHFDKYPLETSKKKDFEIFKELCFLVYTNQHLSKVILEEIIKKAYKMNPSGKRKIPIEKLLKQLAR
ncbi:MAG: homing endonuclease/LAGLIDADG family 23S rRNA group I intron [Candidatus Saganbacteria bacterium]|uniref:Homing endonuclease/LAGLIDADG family 23S rRNA group I intron n=1 Tax=Candidatus Saganbacteria bacterium TaxID=2575572 RepID=A0A833L0J0_UNCSA|nr:MAG: homing endonuclease/LAGLIDADG family 23S rRNA group I intron [Candidatus Saganbacteria bacterium]